MKNKNIFFADYTKFITPYNTNDGSNVKVSVGCRGRSLNENHCTAFDEHRGGLRLLTEEEVLDTVAKLNAEQGWKQGDTEGDETPILTYLQ